MSNLAGATGRGMTGQSSPVLGPKRRGAGSGTAGGPCPLGHSSLRTCRERAAAGSADPDACSDRRERNERARDTECRRITAASRVPNCQPAPLAAPVPEDKVNSGLSPRIGVPRCRSGFAAGTCIAPPNRRSPYPRFDIHRFPVLAGAPRTSMCPDHPREPQMCEPEHGPARIERSGKHQSGTNISRLPRPRHLSDCRRIT